ncbi:MAG: arylsulfatase [Planctomycetales bacterium]|nr:arylsulfatase [Planctomycetales bacterium]
MVAITPMLNDNSRRGRSNSLAKQDPSTNTPTLHGARSLGPRGRWEAWVRAGLLVGVLSLGLTHALRAQDSTERPPNIVVILADDLGYGDVGCYGGDTCRIATPVIDQLAADGMRFTDAHSSSGVCSPSRYTLLTGRYHWRSRLQTGIVGVFGNPLIAADRPTIGTLAQQAGYRTACFGKWHLGWNWDLSAEAKPLFAPGNNGPRETTAEQLAAWSVRFAQPVPGGPTTRGFDRYFGTDVPNWPPYCFMDNDRTVGIPSTLLPRELLGNNQASLPGPALENWSLEPILPRTIDRACEWIAGRAQEDERFLMYVPLTSPHTPLAVNEAWRQQSSLGEAVADLIMETDAEVGRLLRTIDDHGLTNDTLIVFTSDNGFAPYAGAASLVSQGHFPSGPLRGYKGDTWEGGHRVPFIVKWPGVVAAGSTCDALVHHADLFRTVADLLDQVVEPTAGEDSFNLLPLLRGERESIREHAISHSANGLASLRLGSWKLIAGEGGGGPWSNQSRIQPEASDDASGLQLYDLASDIGETNNLAAAQPERVAEMLRLLQQLVEDGRSTPGEPQANDVRVNWQRYLPKE